MEIMLLKKLMLLNEAIQNIEVFISIVHRYNGVTRENDFGVISLS